MEKKYTMSNNNLIKAVVPEAVAEPRQDKGSWSNPSCHSEAAEPHHHKRGWLSLNNMSEAKVNSLPSCPPAFRTSKKAAFTLAEVLITLAIIGVVAAMTIPTLVRNYQEKTTVTKVKKSYAVLNNAYNLSKIDNGPVSKWFSEVSGYTEDEEGNTLRNEAAKNNQVIIFNNLMPYLKVVSTCFPDDDSCKKYTTLKNLNNEEVPMKDIEHFGYFNLTDGSTILGGYVGSLNSCSNKDSYCFDLYVDINGINNEPNTLGKDLFNFLFTSETTKPNGDKLVNFRTFPAECSTDPTNDKNMNGAACAAWVIYNGNMDYLHCDDLSWDGKHSCSD